MNTSENGLLIICLSSVTIYFLIKLLNYREKYTWIKWYSALPKDERKNYNPRLVFLKMEYLMLFTIITGFISLSLSLFINEIFSEIGFIILIISFIFGIYTTSEKNNRIV